MNSTTHSCFREGEYIPRSLMLQWHITHRCNLRCSHCYQDVYSGDEIPFQDLLHLLNQFKDLLQLWRCKANRQVRGHITVTGGEPFIRRDFLDLLNIFSANKRFFSFAILTNGSFIDADMAHQLHKLGPTFVQVSMEGAQVTHDRIRGLGNFERTVSALKYLVRERIRTLISFTAHRGNYREFSKVARIGRKLKVSRVWADRLIPSGIGSSLREQILTPEETHKFIEIMKKARNKVPHCWFGHTEIAMHRALQFLEVGGKPYHCTAGDTLISVQPNGDLYPCRRMPIIIGNLMETPLIELYYKSSLFNTLRDQERISLGCQNCIYLRLCRGGLKCLSYAVTRDPLKADPGCWRASTDPKTAGFKMVSNSAL